MAPQARRRDGQSAKRSFESDPVGARAQCAPHLSIGPKELPRIIFVASRMGRPVHATVRRRGRVWVRQGPL